MSVLNIRNISNIATQIIVQNQRPKTFEAAASFLGMSKKDVRNQLDEGQSLASLAKMHGKKVEELKTAMMKVVPQENQANFSNRIDEMMESSLAPVASEEEGSHPESAPGKSDSVDSIAQFLGLSKQSLAAQIDKGKSLADIAKSKGKSVMDLKKVILNEIPQSQRASLLPDVEAIIGDVSGDQPMAHDMAPSNPSSYSVAVDTFI